VDLPDVELRDGCSSVSPRCSSRPGNGHRGFLLPLLDVVGGVVSSGLLVSLALPRPELFYDCESIDVVSSSYRRRGGGSMNLVVWLPAMFVLGLVSMGLCIAFVTACEKI